MIRQLRATTRSAEMDSTLQARLGPVTQRLLSLRGPLPGQANGTDAPHARSGVIVGICGLVSARQTRSIGWGLACAATRQVGRPIAVVDVDAGQLITVPPDHLPGCQEELDAWLAERVSGAVRSDLLRELAPRCDLVCVCLPNLERFHTAWDWIAQSDGLLLVFQAGRGRLRTAETAVTALRQAEVPILGSVWIDAR